MAILLAVEATMKVAGAKAVDQERMEPTTEKNPKKRPRDGEYQYQVPICTHTRPSCENYAHLADKRCSARRAGYKAALANPRG